MTVVCTACEGQGSHERTATPTEVDNGCELGVAYDECEVCRGRGVVFEERSFTCAACGREFGPVCEGQINDEFFCHPADSTGPTCYSKAMSSRAPSWMSALLGVADHESFDAQAEMGQGPPA
jgi:hypothetical protein